MVRPEGDEPPTYWFVASCSIQLSYGRTLQRGNLLRIPKNRLFGNFMLMSARGRRADIAGGKRHRIRRSAFRAIDAFEIAD